MIPGTAGSQAFAIFKNDPSRTPLPICIVSNTFHRLNYNPTTGRTEDTEGVEVIFPGWGETWSIENLDETPNVFSEYFGSLVYVLKKDPYYVSNFTMRGAPYDFRKAPNENAQFFENLRVLIEETYENAKQRRVVLHPHSMGCLYALAFLKQRTISWKRKYIKSVIFSSCPFGGSVKSLKVEASGKNIYAVILMRSMPSLTFMFPDARLWPASEPLIITPTKNYSTADYKSFFNDINYTVGNMWKDTHSLVDGLEMPSGIDEIHCIHGSNLSTTDKIVYSPPNLFHNGFPDQVPLLVPGNGDGTVSIRSLEYCKYWPGTKYYVLPGAEHVHIMSDIRHINIVLKILGANITHG
ncbi:unnamed protein product [Trichobilharzia regenti]|nr:unnamed protein product [Trichobilharzia regenti]